MRVPSLFLINPESQENTRSRICASSNSLILFIIPDLHYSSHVGPLCALFVVLLPSMLGRAVALKDARTGPVVIASEVSALPLGGNSSPVVIRTGTEADETSTGDIERVTAIASTVPEDSATSQLASFPTRPIFDNSTRFHYKKNYTDPDAPIVTSFRNASDLTTYHIEDTEVVGRSLLEQYHPFGGLLRETCV